MKVRELFSYFKPYEWETPDWKIAEEYNLKLDQIIRMDLNTSPYLPQKWLKNLESKIKMMKINGYPDATYRELVNEISNYVGVRSDKIIPTNGADEAIDIIVRTFVDSGSEVILSSPTYDYFRVSVELQGGRIINIQRKNDFKDDVDRIISSITDKIRAIFLCSPNNPTGNTIEYNDIVRILDEVTDTAVIVDEAYYEYSGRTFIELTDSYDNLIIIRTLSKAFGLAGARIGYIVASRETAKLISKVRPPNSLSIPSIELAIIALKDSETVIRNARKIVKERERVRELLSALPKLKVYPSEANFILFKLVRGNPKNLHRRLMERGIIIRDLDHVPGLQSHFRVTVSVPENNNRFLKLLEKLLEEV
ncbi:MAG: histidinol-phosphate transaminase [Candidatus Caldarchaeales archaeon]